jgi:hypothetical protein
MNARPTPAELAQRIAEARLPKAYQNMTRGTWRETWPDGDTPWPEAATSWIRGAGGPILIIRGPVGCGKTHVAAAILRHYLGNVGGWVRPQWWTANEAAARCGALYLTAAELAEEYDAGRYRGRPLLEQGLKAPLVLVDDGAWNGDVADLERGGLARLIHNASETGHSLLITTNLDRDTLTRQDRIASRLAAGGDDGLIVELKGRDRR